MNYDDIGAKHPSIDALLTDLSGKDRPSTIANRGCVFCDKPNLEFKTKLDAQEYVISGICQTCQDDAFAPDDEDESGLEREFDDDEDDEGGEPAL